VQGQGKPRGDANSGMKPAPFDYVRPKTLAEACRLLQENEDALPIAGGQTLVPMLAMRLARPTMLVDIQRLPELSGIARNGNVVVIGAATRQAAAEVSDVIRAGVPLLAAALPWVGHQPTRNRGTIGGSIANADPAAEIPLVAATLQADIVVAHADGSSIIAARDFFRGAMSTALPAGGCLREVRFPVWTEGRIGVGFHEISARRSDFAYVAAAAQVALGEDARCLRVALGLGGLADRPLVVDMGELVGSRLGDMAIEASVRRAVEAVVAGLAIASDLHAGADYRRRLALTLATRALNDAVAQASGAA
jgi:CO/xanthine dehydrogenase FAD-binding subunit